ncbi:hypothetical protein Tco_1528438, partial [Tanacetum coccineum]
MPLSPPSPVLAPAPPPSPIRQLGYQAAMIQMRAEAASTSQSPPSSPPFILPPTRPDAPLPLPLLPPSASYREDRPEVTLPPRKRLGIAFGPRYNVEESSAIAAARPAGGLRADYNFVATMGSEIRRDPERYSLSLRRAHGHIRLLMETEARISREAWGRAMDACDLAHGEVISLGTTVQAQALEIRELQSADRKRQYAISDLLKIDRRRREEMRELRTADRTRQQQ